MARSKSDSPRSSGARACSPAERSTPDGPRRTSSTTGDANTLPDFAIETELLALGARFVAGVDEVGRGPLAGPVVAAAVIFDDVSAIPDGIRDSKMLSAQARRQLADRIMASGFVAIASVCAAEIDRINIRQATFRAMEQAIAALPVVPDRVLVDGRELPPTCRDNGLALVKGDARSLSIAAASIVAKVVRDRMMARANDTYTPYGFASHSGYGTARHLAALDDHGPCAIHRMTFRPLAVLARKR